MNKGYGSQDPRPSRRSISDTPQSWLGPAVPEAFLHQKTPGLNLVGTAIYKERVHHE
jgi:hypothetical protein